MNNLSLGWEVLNVSNFTLRQNYGYIGSESAGYYGSGISFADNGNLLLGLSTDGFNSHFRKYALSTPWDVSTRSNIIAKTISSSAGRGIRIDSGGSTILTYDSYAKQCRTYSMSTPFDVTTMINTANYSVASIPATIQDIQFSYNGKYAYIATSSGNRIYQYELTTSWDTSSMVSTGNILVLPTTYSGPMLINQTGEQMIFSIPGGQKLLQYTLTTPFDITTAVNTGYEFTINSSIAFAMRDDSSEFLRLTPNAQGGFLYGYNTNN